MNIEYESSCDYDYLEIKDHLRGISRRLCGSLYNYNSNGGPLCININSQSVVISFYSDSTETNTGFELTYKSQSKDPYKDYYSYHTIYYSYDNSDQIKCVELASLNGKKLSSVFDEVPFCLPQYMKITLCEYSLFSAIHILGNGLYGRSNKYLYSTSLL